MKQNDYLDISIKAGIEQMELNHFISGNPLWLENIRKRLKIYFFFRF